ncbi:ADP-glyceromanno-heptose 6-epimerase [bacterium]|nr:ADP-glyceromanno-heptose 6-epimerase [bacterium]MBU1072894.1 ADP-glyceromanno-heptose 6-epimerase [bacterium]MBU1675908.1 ADP-glyceromanno-heptose 6-epimerase [bacterium]
MSGTIIVTGGAGFIGANIVRELNARGADDVVIVDRLRHGDKWRNLAVLRFEDFVDKDVFRDDVLTDTVPYDVDAIVHMGACSSTTETDADYLADNNYRYTRDLCEWCLRRGVRFVYASSAATYGDGSRGYSDDDAATPALRPLNMYGYSKHMFDLWALRHGLFERIVGLKYFNVYGPLEDHKGDMRSVVNKAHGQIVEKGKVELFKSYRPEYADGGQVRDFVYVRDAVDVTLHFLEDRDTGGLFNCGTGRARSWTDLANATFVAAGREPDIEFIQMPPDLREKYQYHTEADLTKLRAAGYGNAFTSLEDGVRDYVCDHLAVES